MKNRIFIFLFLWFMVNSYAQLRQDDTTSVHRHRVLKSAHACFCPDLMFHYQSDQ